MNINFGPLGSGRMQMFLQLQLVFQLGSFGAYNAGRPLIGFNLPLFQMFQKIAPHLFLNVLEIKHVSL